MRKTFIWSLAVLLMACGAVKDPEASSRSDGDDAAPLKLQTLLVEAMDYSENCCSHVMDPFGPTPRVTLPFEINFFGTTYSQLFVNLDGNVSFNGPAGGVPPVVMTADTPPIIAPFLVSTYIVPFCDSPIPYCEPEDLKTRIYFSNKHYKFEGRPAFSVIWRNVRYSYKLPTDKLNTFQLILVDRSDEGVGDFDIVMNYDHIQWEAMELLKGQEVPTGLGDPSATAGFSAGNGQAHAFYSFPGSLVSGSFLDTHPDLGLARTRHNSEVMGRHIFKVRNGVSPDPRGGRITGTVTDDASPPNPLPGALVQLCPATPGPCNHITRTGPSGQYNVLELAEGDYRITVFPPEDSLTRQTTVDSVHLAADATLEANVVLNRLAAMPPHVQLSPTVPNKGGVPSVYTTGWLDMRTTGCRNGEARYRMTHPNGAILSGEMEVGQKEEHAWEYRTRFLLLRGEGLATVEILIQCPNGTWQNTVFSLFLYLDPSGTVRTLSGRPVPDARVTLYRAESASGPFEVVPDGSAMMSPDNRDNWDLTDAEGRFRWDVIGGYYRVRAEREGCLAPSGAPYVETEVLPVPPPVTGLELRLDCPGLEDTTPPVSTASLSTAPNVHGWHHAPVTIQLVATDEDSNVESLTYSLSGAQAGGASVPGAGAQVTLSTEGTTVLTWFARDEAGNEESPQVLEVRLDMTAPSLSCQASPDRLPRPNHQLMPVRVDVRLGDALSGAGSFLLKAATSNEPDNGLGDGDTEDDLHQWEVGTADTQGLLRAERAGKGTGRVYTLSYEGQDQAGNVAACSAVVSVPHDRRR